MKVVDSIVNGSEEAVLHELQKIASDNALRVFTKFRLSDLIQKGGTHLTNREFDFYTRSHCDFVVADDETRPLLAVEYDGPLHQSSAEQIERDEIKNELCRRAGLGLLRINDNYVTKIYRGMTVLRWIIEVTKLEKAFNAAQEEGPIAWDESFDPAFLEPAGSGGAFPIGLVPPQTNPSISSSIRLIAESQWASMACWDRTRTVRRADFRVFTSAITSFGRPAAFESKTWNFQITIYWTRSIRANSGCSWRFRRGAVRASTVEEFRPIFERFCERYNAHPSYSMGAFPFEAH
ncbi:DUF2726 domain-containing protein [Bradyrhizobium sp. CB3481]|uniref:DUF2726 domain-containing protein n=1 Tax=Bradyrhizobium sp. CB3481 TaxID=3039158 RepID=UPI0024B0B504|nr:DUF2726 domain-containing protein [Bradyrhizobium sp. CB3481]WFU14651.1 DUF2726 domain-containing protein [Bradyrhizobium sp. CB3481]